MVNRFTFLTRSLNSSIWTTCPHSKHILSRCFPRHLSSYSSSPRPQYPPAAQTPTDTTSIPLSSTSIPLPRTTPNETFSSGSVGNSVLPPRAASTNPRIEAIPPPDELPTTAELVYTAKWFTDLPAQVQLRVKSVMDRVDSVIRTQYKNRYKRTSFALHQGKVASAPTMPEVASNRPVSTFSNFPENSDSDKTSTQPPSMSDPLQSRWIKEFRARRRGEKYESAIGSSEALPSYIRYRRKPQPEHSNDQGPIRELMSKVFRKTADFLKRSMDHTGHGSNSDTGMDSKLTLRSVTAAVLGNTIVCLCKFVAAWYSGSGVLFAESLHSLADVINQALLMVGIQQSEKKPSALHPYGYGPARFAYALVSATGVFFLGCGVSVYHGIGQLLQPELHAVELSGLITNVLLLSLLIEGASCLYAVTVINTLRRNTGMSFWQYIKEGSDTTAIAVVVEDLVAMAGILTAIVTLWLTAETGNSIWDTVGTLVVGLGMGCVAYFLIRRNMNILMGKSFTVSKQREIMDVLRSRPSVLSIHDMKTVTYGENDSRFKAEIQFHGRQLAKQVLYGPPPEIGEFWRKSDLSSDLRDSKGEVLPFPRRRAALPNTDGALAGRLLLQLLQKSDRPALTKRDAEDLLLRFGDEIVQEVGREVDSVERMMKLNFPFITHVDLESHVPSFVPQEDEYHSASYHNKYVNRVLVGNGIGVNMGVRTTGMGTGVGSPLGVSAAGAGAGTGAGAAAQRSGMGESPTTLSPDMVGSGITWNSTSVAAKTPRTKDSGANAPPNPNVYGRVTDSRSYASSYYHYLENMDELPVFAVDGLFAEHVHYRRSMATMKMNPQALAEESREQERMYADGEGVKEEDDEVYVDVYSERNEYRRGDSHDSNASTYYDATDVVRREENEEWERTSY